MLEGTTGTDGSLTEEIPEAAQAATLVLWPEDYPTGPRERYALTVDDVPNTTVALFVVALVGRSS